MAEENLEKIITDRYHQLPKEVSEIIEFGILDRAIQTIVSDHGLTPDQALELENRLYLILLFFIPSTDLAKQIEDLLQVDSFRASIIADYLNTEIFGLIEEILELTNEKFLLNESKTSLAASSVTATVAPSTIEKVSPFRTMEGDAKKIHGYGAFRGAEPAPEDQPVYRSEQAKLVPPPSYTDDSSTPKGS